MTYLMKQIPQTDEEAQKKWIFPKLHWYTPIVRNEFVPICQGRPFDRTETVDLGWKQKILSPIPEFEYTSKSFTEVCADRAVEIANMAKEQGKKVIVTCSGGMDSTSVIAAFLMYTDIDIELTYSESAILEWPEFHTYCTSQPRITRLIDFTYMPFLMEKLIEAGNYIIVGGDPGDLIFGSKMYREDQKIWQPDGSEIVYNMDHWAPVWEGVPSHHRDFLQPIVDACPVDLENNYDLTWWLGFCMKFQLTETRLWMCSRKMAPVINFFSSAGCQQWSMSNSYAVKCPNNNWDDLKHEAKKHLHLWFPDDSVWQQVKRDSLGGVWTEPLNRVFYAWIRDLHEAKIDAIDSYLVNNIPELREKNYSFKQDRLDILDGYDHGRKMLGVGPTPDPDFDVPEGADTTKRIRGQMYPVSTIDENFNFVNWPRHKIATRVWQKHELNEFA